MSKETSYVQGRVGLAFKNGKLYEFTKRHVLVVTGGDDPRAWFKRRSHGWKATRKWADELFMRRVFNPPDIAAVSNVPVMEPVPGPDGDPVFDPEEEKRQARELWWRNVLRREAKVLADYSVTIPSEIRCELNKYRSRLWHLYNVLARCPGATDLSRSSPALLFALTNNWVFHKPAVTHPMRAIRRLVNKKQKVILEWLGFPATEPVRRVMAKITPETLTIARLLILRKVFQQPESLNKVAHLETLNGPVCDLIQYRKFQGVITPRLLADVSQLTPGAVMNEQMNLFYDTLRMADAVGWKNCPRQFHSLRGVRRIHDDLVRRMNQHGLCYRVIRLVDEDGRNAFPPPPFAGTDSVLPILSAWELSREGAEMGHCVAIHAERVFSGYVYVYRVLEPVRATLMITRVPGGWIPCDIALKCNGRVDKTVAAELFRTLFESGDYKVDVREDGMARAATDVNISAILPALSSLDHAILKGVMETFGGTIVEVRM